MTGTSTTTPQIDKSLIGRASENKHAARAASQCHPLQNNNVKLPHLQF